MGQDWSVCAALSAIPLTYAHDGIKGAWEMRPRNLLREKEGWILVDSQLFVPRQSEDGKLVRMYQPEQGLKYMMLTNKFLCMYIY